MFTGLVEDVGKCEYINKSGGGCEISISSEKLAGNVGIGDSVSVDGACLTITSILPAGFTVHAGSETLEKTNLGKLRTGVRINLERAMKLSGRLDGHIVNGHVDSTAKLLERKDSITKCLFRVSMARKLSPYIVEKGSVTLDGVSLTVADKRSESFTVAIIPHTLKNTALEMKRPGSIMNIEVDILAKYVESLLAV